MLINLISGDRPRSRILTIVLLAIFFGLLFAPFLFPGVRSLETAARISVFILLAASYDLLLGYTGVVSFAHTMFFGMGAYGVGLASQHMGRGFGALIAGSLAGAALAAALAFVIALFSLRVRAIFFAMITLAVASAVAVLVSQLSQVTGGEDGFTFQIPRALGPANRLGEVMGVPITGKILNYYVVFFTALVLFLVLLRIVNSPFGRVLQIDVIPDRERQLACKGFAFVQFSTPEEAVAAKALSGTVIEGKSIDVRLKAEPRAPREDKFANAAPVNEAAKLYVAYMPENYGADELRMLLQPYGLPSDVRVISDRETGRSRGFGFAQMMDEQQAHSAIQGLNGQIIDGKQLVVRIAGDKPPPRQVHPYGGYNPYGGYPGYGVQPGYPAGAGYEAAAYAADPAMAAQYAAYYGYGAQAQAADPNAAAGVPAGADDAANAAAWAAYYASYGYAMPGAEAVAAAPATEAGIEVGDPEGAPPPPPPPGGPPEGAFAVGDPAEAPPPPVPVMVAVPPPPPVAAAPPPPAEEDDMEM